MTLLNTKVNPDEMKLRQGSKGPAVKPISLHLTPVQVAGPIGKTISRVGADAQVAHADAGAALEHLELAEQIDERGDAELTQALICCQRAARSESAAERADWMRAAIGHMVKARELDDLEESHWKVYATERVVTSREACIRIVERTESVLTRRGAA